jgi:hypothetical protein
MNTDTNPGNVHLFLFGETFFFLVIQGKESILLTQICVGEWTVLSSLNTIFYSMKP